MLLVPPSSAKAAGGVLKPQRYIIATFYRTGSSLLAKRLNEHPAAVCAGEAAAHFHENGKHRRTLWEWIDRDYTPRGKVPAWSGFKWHADHPFGDELSDDADLAVILLYRRDLLAQVVSHMVWQYRRGDEQSPVEGSKDQPVVVAGANQIIEEMQARLAVMDSLFRRFGKHPSVTVSYEGLCEGKDTDRISRFLEISPFEYGYDENRRHQPRPLSKVVSCYNQVKDSPYRYCTLNGVVPDGQ